MPPSQNTAMGHLNQEKTNLQFTQDDHFPSSESPNKKSNNHFISIEKFDPTNKAYTDLTGRFLVQSSRGNQYILVCYSYDSNAILAEPLRNRSAPEIVKTWQIINNKLEKAGVQPELYLLDNECSNEFRDALHKKEIKFQLVPPNIHHCNAAERAIQTFKNHFLAGLSSCNPKFPLREWDRLIAQAVITLNLLRNSRINPKLSSHAFLFGNFDFNKCPMTPPGMQVVVHSKPNNRASWAFNGKSG